MQDRMRAADIELAGVRVDAGAALNAEGTALPAIERVIDRALAALCAEAVGVMSRAQEITVEYLKVRRQFGALLGSFQALQHRAVDMLVLTEQARSMAMYAAMMCRGSESGGTLAGHGRRQSADRQVGQIRRRAGHSIARRHRRDRGMPGRALLPAPHDDRNSVRRPPLSLECVGAIRRTGAGVAPRLTVRGGGSVALIPRRRSFVVEPPDESRQRQEPVMRQTCLDAHGVAEFNHPLHAGRCEQIPQAALALRWGIRRRFASPHSRNAAHP